HQSLEGYYNATLVQLDDSKERLSRMLDYGWDFDEDGNTRPPIWISVVGQDGHLVPVYHVPFGLIKSGDEEGLLKYMYRRPPQDEEWTAHKNQLHPGRMVVPNIWVLLFLTSGFTGMYVLAKVLAGQYLRRSRWGATVQDRLNAYKQ